MYRIIIYHIVGFFSLIHINLYAQEETLKIHSKIQDIKKLYKDRLFEGLSLSLSRKNELAITKFIENEKNNPKDALTLYYLSQSYFKLQKNDLAYQYILKALNEDYDNIWYLYAFFDISNSLHLSNEEIKQNLKAYNYKIAIRLAQIYANNKDFKTALKTLELLELKNLKNARTIDLYKKIYVSKINQKNITTQKKTNHELEYSYSWFQQEIEHGLKTNDSELSSMLDNALIRYPTQAYLYYLYGKYHQINHQYKLAITHLNTALDFNTNDKSLDLKIYTSLARVYKQIGDIELSNQYLKKCDSP